MPPRWTRAFAAVDQRAPWEGVVGRAGPTSRVRIEAAAHRGRADLVRDCLAVDAPRAYDRRSRGRAPKLMRQAVFLTLLVLLLVGSAGFMARRNLVLGRGDRGLYCGCASCSAASGWCRGR